MRLAVLFLAVCTALPFASVPVAAQTAPMQTEAEGAGVQRAITLLDRGLYEEARTMLEPLAEARDPDAVYMLGYIHDRGLGVPSDDSRARRRYVVAAMDGQPDAQFALGELAYAGRGVQRDYRRAYEWFDLAAAKGHARAAYMLGVLHAEGRGAPKDPGRAADLYERAAEAGVTAAMHQLGAMALAGEGRPQSYTEAARWFEQAAGLGDRDSQYNLALLHDSGRLPGEADLEEAVRWMRAAASSSPKAQIAMGLFSLRGRGTEQSDEAAARWFALAADLGDAEGMFLHAAALAEGLGQPRDVGAALGWAERSLRASAGEPMEVLEERRTLRDDLRAALTPKPEAPRAAPTRPAVVLAPARTAEAAPDPEPEPKRRRGLRR